MTAIIATLGSAQPPDCAEQYYHESWRNKLELLLCVAMVVAYLPQYIAIWCASSVAGISPYYILYHALFSTLALCIRIASPVYYNAFNCIKNGTLKGWQATSVLTGYFQVGVQWFCAMVLVALFLQRYDQQLHKGIEPDAPSPRDIEITVISVAIALLPLSILFLWRNEDEWIKLALVYGLIVYGFTLIFFLLIPHLGFTFGFGLIQFFYQTRLLTSMKARGTLSIISTGLLFISFLSRAGLQLLRSRPNLNLEWRTDINYIDLITYQYYQESLTLGYLVAGMGNLVLFILCWYYDWRSILGISTVAPAHLH